MKKNRPRDAEGYRIPRPGSKSHQIYTLMKAGMRPMEIAAALRMTVGSVRVLQFRILNPDKRY